MFARSKQPIAKPKGREELPRQMVVTRVTPSSNGIHLTAELPIGYDAVHLVIAVLERAGIDLHGPMVSGTSGQSGTSSITFGPFQELVEAKQVIEVLREEVATRYQMETEARDKFASLLGEYPLE